MTDRKVKKLTPNSIANLVMATEAWHDSLYVRAEDYDSLKAEYDKVLFVLKGVSIGEIEADEIDDFLKLKR